MIDHQAKRNNIIKHFEGNMKTKTIAILPLECLIPLFIENPMQCVRSIKIYDRNYALSLEKSDQICYNKYSKQGGFSMARDVVSAKLDIIFKKLFTENEDMLHSFVASMLDVPQESISEIKITNPELPPETLAGKFNYPM